MPLSVDALAETVLVREEQAVSVYSDHSALVVLLSLPATSLFLEDSLQLVVVVVEVLAEATGLYVADLGLEDFVHRVSRFLQNKQKVHQLVFPLLPVV